MFKVQKGITQWDPISFTVEYKIMYKETPIYNQLQISSKQGAKDLQNPFMAFDEGKLKFYDSLERIKHNF